MDPRPCHAGSAQRQFQLRSAHVFGAARACLRRGHHTPSPHGGVLTGGSPVLEVGVSLHLMHQRRKRSPLSMVVMTAAQACSGVTRGGEFVIGEGGG
jgi:hypothetical protein